MLTILLMAIFWHIHSLAQSSVSVQGSIIDSAGQPLSGATIQLWFERDTISVLSTARGNFIVAVPTYFTSINIRITMRGYQPYLRENVSLSANSKTVSISPIRLQVAYQELQPVVIQQERPLMIKGDTIRYNAGTYTLRSGAMLGDLLKKLPAIRIDPDSNVYVEGKKITKVLLDGKEFFHGDVKNAIRNLPYDIIDKIDIVDDYGDQARITGIKTGDPDKVMNVILRQDHQNGQFGNIEAGPGGLGQYNALASANAFFGPRKISILGAATNNNPFGEERVKVLDVNYADNWNSMWSGSGDIGIWWIDHLFGSSANQNSYYSAGNTQLEQTTINLGSKAQQQLNYEWLYAPGVRTKLRIDVSGLNQSTKEIDQITLSSIEQDSGFSKTSKSTTTNQLNGTNTVTETKLHFENNSPKLKQQFTTDVNFKFEKNAQSGENFSLTRILANSILSQVQQHYRINNSDIKLNLDGSLHYFYPLGTNSHWEVNYGLHKTLERIGRTWQQPDSLFQNWIVVDSLSNNYRFSILTQDFRTGYGRHSDKTDIDVTLVAEPINLNGITAGKSGSQVTHSFNFFPFVAFTYSPGRSQKLRIGYSNTLILPTIQQIQPVTDLSNPQYPVTGNSNLRPSINRLVSLNYEFNSLKKTNYYGFGIGFSYSDHRNQIISNIVHPKDTASTIQQTYFENINGNNILKFDWHIDFPAFPNKRLKISYTGSVSELHNISLVDYLPVAVTTMSNDNNLNVTYSVPDKLDVNLYLLSTYSVSRVGNAPVNTTSLTWGMNNKHYFLQNWIVSYEIMQTFNNGTGNDLTKGPTVFNVHFERSFFTKRQLTCTLSGINLFNENAGQTETVTQDPTTVTINRSKFVARNFLFTVQWKFDRFPKTN